MATFNNVPLDAQASNIYIELAGVNRSLASFFNQQTVGLVGMYDPIKTGVIDYEPVQVTSRDEVGSLFGFGTHIHRQALRIPIAVFSQGGGVWAFPIPDGGTAATIPIVFAVNATSSGTYFFAVGGELIQFSVAKDDTPDIIGQSFADAITSKRDVFVTAVNALGTVTLTAKNKGLAGDDVYVKLNPGGTNQETQNPSSTTVAGADAYMASGATDPSVESVFFDVGGNDKLGDRWYNLFTCPFSDATNLGFYKSAGDGRNDPAIKRMFGASVGYVKETYTQQLAIAATINSEWISPAWDARSLAPAWELSAALIGEISDAANQSPARPFKTIETGIEVNSSIANLSPVQADALYKSGTTYFKIDSSGTHRIGDVALSFRTDSGGGASREWFAMTDLTLRQAKVFSIDQLLLTDKYERAVVVDNQSVTTADYAIAPKDIIADFTKLIDDLWVRLAWTKNRDEVVNSLAAEINAGNNGRIDSSVIDDEAKPLRVIAVKYAFLK